MVASPGITSGDTVTKHQAHLYQLPLTPYEDAWQLQQTVHRARVDNTTTDTLLLLEHPPTYTVGRRVEDAFRLVDENARIEHGIPIYQTERGGLITYHGPGQLVGYPILKLMTYCRGPKTYMHMLEDVLIRLLQEFGLQAGRRDRCTGVWIADRKIAALGVHISRGVTMHGFALNVTNDLRPYEWIVPCGIEGCIVTSMTKELGARVGVAWVSNRLCKIFAETFGLEFQQERHDPLNNKDEKAYVT
ncbi:MAG TPA: lipoyl(octanoyl) transferase LipB [Nitrospirales bacterium]|nr:lipoyl(octanoyl) transferase LipB [Nitrospirales bacterium]HIN32414.1 lipoyl(octanoyl) transferase LipB [Nitrospirales bacterium]